MTDNFLVLVIIVEQERNRVDVSKNKPTQKVDHKVRSTYVHSLALLSHIVYYIMQLSNETVSQKQISSNKILVGFVSITCKRTLQTGICEFLPPVLSTHELIALSTSVFNFLFLLS